MEEQKTDEKRPVEHPVVAEETKIEVISIDEHNARRDRSQVQKSILKTRAAIATIKRLVVKKELLPVRCEICHQSDLFDPETKYSVN